VFAKAGEHTEPRAGIIQPSDDPLLILSLY
jgi:hypothetical protein